MKILLDTNIIARLVDIAHPMHPIADAAIALLRTQGDELCLVPQVFYEIWVVGTRPKNANGLGKTVAEMIAFFNGLKAFYSFIPDRRSEPSFPNGNVW